MHIVYIRFDESFRVTAITSDAFLDDTSGWTQLDCGSGDRYRHAQNNYLPKPLFTPCGIAQYRYENGVIVERTQAEINTDAAELPLPAPTPMEVNAANIEYIAMMCDIELEV